MDETNQPVPPVTTNPMAPVLQPYQVPSGFIEPQMLATNSTPASGDMQYSNGTQFVTLAIGKTNQLLSVQKSVPIWVDNNGWIKDLNTWTYSSTDGHTFVVTVNADVTTTIGLGDRVWVTNQSASQYFIVTKISVSLGTTTISMYGGTQYSLTNTTISAPYYSHDKSPFGFNTRPDYWTETLSDTTRRTQSSPVASTWYNLGSLSIAVPIGVWDMQYQIQAGPTINGTSSDMYITLSTANNSESDSDFTSYVSNNGATATVNQIETMLSKRKTIALTSKTSYFLNGRTTTASVTNIAEYNDLVAGYVRAICGYL